MRKTPALVLSYPGECWEFSIFPPLVMQISVPSAKHFRISFIFPFAKTFLNSSCISPFSTAESMALSFAFEYHRVLILLFSYLYLQFIKLMLLPPTLLLCSFPFFHSPATIRIICINIYLCS